MIEKRDTSLTIWFCRTPESLSFFPYYFTSANCDFIIWKRLKINVNESSHINFTIKPCLCCVQLSFHCYGHVFFSVILLQFDRKK